MKISCRNISGCALVVLGLVMALSIPRIAQAEKLREFYKNWTPIEFLGRVDRISPEGDTLFVNEKLVVLVDLVYQGKHYATNIKDSDGEKINFGKIKVGSFVFIRGGVLPDNKVGARDIFLLPKQILNKEIKNYPALTQAGSWQH